MNKYWIVIGEQPAADRLKHHTTRSAAGLEARRLALEHRYVAFTVFEAIEVSASNEVQTTILYQTEEVPL